jgi:hypothetical protein
MEQRNNSREISHYFGDDASHFVTDHRLRKLQEEAKQLILNRPFEPNDGTKPGHSIMNENGTGFEPETKPTKLPPSSLNSNRVLKGRVQKASATVKDKKANTPTSSSFTGQAMEGPPMGAEKWVEGTPGSELMAKEELENVDKLDDLNDVTTKEELNDTDGANLKVQEELKNN